MKNKLKAIRMIAGIIALTAVITFLIAGCGGNENEPTPETVTYQGTANGVTYTLKIIENTSRAAYTPKNGDSYELTVGAKKSTGTVQSVSGGTLTLKPSGAGEAFTATVSSSGITAMTDTITFDDGSSQPAPTAITPVPPSTGGNDDGTYALGSTGPGGGKVFYYSEAGFTMSDNGQVCHYLEAAPDDMPATLAWASSGYSDTNITGTAEEIGAGRKNTALILATDANAPAAKACNDYRGGGKTDWFLPSKDELNTLYQNRASVGNMGTSGSGYWSSSQGNYYGGSSGYAWYRLFIGVGDAGLGYTAKANNAGVRAVRCF